MAARPSRSRSQRPRPDARRAAWWSRLESDDSRAVPLALESGRPIWTDLHDYDGARSLHAPFIDAAEVVFVSHDRLAAPAAFLESMIQRGKRLAVCTMAGAGATAFDADRRWYEVPAEPVGQLVDANGAGDAFFAGVLFGVLSGVPLERACATGRSRAPSPSPRRISRRPTSAPNASGPRPFDRCLPRPYHWRSRGGAAAARRAHNPKVKGSNPFPATKLSS